MGCGARLSLVVFFLFIPAGVIDAAFLDAPAWMAAGNQPGAHLSVLDVTGRERIVLAQGFQPAGPHSADWRGRDAQGRECPAGLYLIRLVVDDAVALGKVVRVR